MIHIFHVRPPVITVISKLVDPLGHISLKIPIQDQNTQKNSERAPKTYQSKFDRKKFTFTVFMIFFKSRGKCPISSLEPSATTVRVLTEYPSGH